MEKYKVKHVLKDTGVYLLIMCLYVQAEPQVWRNFIQYPQLRKKCEASNILEIITAHRQTAPASKA